MHSQPRGMGCLCSKEVTIEQQYQAQNDRNEEEKVIENATVHQKVNPSIQEGLHEEYKQAEVRQRVSSETAMRKPQKKRNSSAKEDVMKVFDDQYQTQRALPLQHIVHLNLSYYKGKRIICNDIYSEFADLCQANKEKFFRLITKNQIVYNTPLVSFNNLNIVDEGSEINVGNVRLLQKYLQAKSLNFNKVESCKFLIKGGESQVLRLKVIQPVEIVIRMPLNLNNNEETNASLRKSLMESHMIKLLAHKDHVAEILEEIIEYNQEQDLIVNYVSIVEQATNDFFILSNTWKNAVLAQQQQEYFSDEKLTYICLKAMQAIQYLHSQNVYYGDMKPQNLLVFRDFSVKLGDFGTAIKLPSNYKELNYKCYLKGMTPYYSNDKIESLFENDEMVGYEDLFQNDYYGLFFTFQQICKQFKDQIDVSSIFCQVLERLQSIKVFTYNDLSSLICFTQELIQNKEDFILKLCDQMINEEKLEAIGNILCLSKYKSVFSQIQKVFEQKKNEEFVYFKRLQQIEEDYLQSVELGNYEEMISLIKEELVQYDIVDFNKYIQRQLVYKGSFEQNFYRSTYREVFGNLYQAKAPIVQLLFDIDFSIEKKNEIASYFRENIQEFDMMASFYSCTTKIGDHKAKDMLEFLIQFAYDSNNLQIDLLFNYICVFSLSTGYDSQIKDYVIASVGLYKENKTNEKIKSRAVQCCLQFFISLVNSYSSFENWNFVEANTFLKQIDGHEQYMNKSYYSKYYYAQAQIITQNPQNKLQLLLNERQQYKRVFGEQGDEMARSAFDIYSAYAKMGNEYFFDKQRYLKKATNYSHKKQRILYLGILANEYNQQMELADNNDVKWKKREKLIKTIQRYGEIDKFYEYLALSSFNYLYEFDDKLTQNYIKEFKDSRIYQKYEYDIKNNQILKKGLESIFGVQIKKGIDLSVYYHQWTAKIEQTMFDQFSMEAQSSNKFEEQPVAQFIYQDGTIYTGEHVNLKQQGKGELLFFDQRNYKGSFFENKKQGFGIFTYSNGDVYTGEYHDNQKNGKGIFISAEFGKYEGLWFNGMKSGQGLQIYPSLDTYEGEWLEDTRHGQGHQKYTDGQGYIGEYKHDMRDGQGKYYFDNGDIIDGVWRKDKVHGQAYQKTGQTEYTGNYYKDIKQGQGKLTNEDGEYNGEFLNDQKQGFGIMIYHNGDKYEGAWAEDKKQGYGKQYYSSEEIYEGMWHQNEKVV